MVVIELAEQIVCEAGVANALGVGFTSTVAVIDAPGQPLAVGVIVKVTVTGALVVLVSTPPMSPLPLAGMPVTVTVLSLVQLNVVPVVLPVRTIVVIADDEQIVCEAGVATAFGVGFTSIVAVIDAPEQLLAVGVIVKVLLSVHWSYSLTPADVATAVGWNASDRCRIVSCPVECSSCHISGQCNGSD